MKQFAVIGCPIEHSLSPELYAGLFAERGIDAEFARLLVFPDELPFIRRITGCFSAKNNHLRGII